ncbi:MAG: hypothetical protein QXT28_09090 [Thermofilaceae archaeon]
MSEEKRKVALELVPSLLLGDPRIHGVPYVSPEVREDISLLASADVVTANLDAPQAMLASLLYREAVLTALRVNNRSLAAAALASWLSFLAHTKAKEGRVMSALLSSLHKEEYEEEEEEKWWKFWKRGEGKRRKKGEEE